MTENLLLAFKLIRSHSSWIKSDATNSHVRSLFAAREEITPFVSDRSTNDFRFSPSWEAFVDKVVVNSLELLESRERKTLIDLQSQTHFALHGFKSAVCVRWVFAVRDNTINAGRLKELSADVWLFELRMHFFSRDRSSTRHNRRHLATQKLIIMQQMCQNPSRQKAPLYSRWVKIIGGASVCSPLTVCAGSRHICTRRHRLW